MTYRKLKGRIVEIYSNQKTFAKTLSIGENLLSRKLNGLCAITQEDVYKWSKLLKIEPQDIGLYFFPQMFNENEV